MQSVDPMVRGAGDISFVAPSVNSLDGLGAFGSGFHAPENRSIWAGCRCKASGRPC